MASSVGRYDEFYTSLAGLDLPGTTHDGLNTVTGILKCTSACVATGLNAACRAALADPARQWVWFLGDDHTFDPGLLVRLLNRNVDVVVPLVAMRYPPYPTVLFKGPGGPRYAWVELPTTGMMPLPVGHVAGQAGMLVRRRVLEVLEPPWFRIGQYEPASLHEDIYFTESLSKKGITIHVDCDEMMGHLQVFDVQPSRSLTGHWQPAIVASGGVEQISSLNKTKFFV
jgi:hypothetical protein